MAQLERSTHAAIYIWPRAIIAIIIVSFEYLRKRFKRKPVYFDASKNFRHCISISSLINLVRRAVNHQHKNIVV